MPTAAPLRLVLFGLPGSGKSSLLGALSHASVTQPTSLGGRFTQVANEFQLLRKQVDEGAVRPTLEEVVHYTLAYQPQDNTLSSPTPLPDEPPGLSRRDDRRDKPGGSSRESEGREITAEFIDCNGKAAGDLLGQVATDGPVVASDQLDRALDRADGLILVVDASTSPAQLEDQFAALGRFLTQFEAERGQRIEVSGLPVFLVLTKCDLLAHAGDTMISWMERIEQRKREVDARFRELLARRESSEAEAPFGQIDLNLWATAIRQPALTSQVGRIASPSHEGSEPFGVAELFRQSLEKADDYRQRQVQSGRRLFWTSSLASLLVALMLSGTVGLAVFNQPKQQNPLEVAVDALRYNEAPTVAGRLRLPAALLRQKLERLKEIEADPGFPALSEGLRGYVTSRIEEINDYLGYLARIIQAPQPADQASEEQLNALRRRLETESDLKPRPEWERTTAAGLYQELLRDLDRIQDAVRQLVAWFQDYGTRSQELARFEIPGLRGRAWNVKARELLQETRQVPLTDQPFLPGSQTVTPALVLAIVEVKQEHAFWARQRQRLEGVRSLLGALGLLGNASGLPPLLNIPAPFTLEAAAPLAGEVRHAYPHALNEFVLAGLPDDVRREVVETAKTYYEPLLRPGQAAVLTRLREAGSGPLETPARWDAVRKWLENPAQLAEWRFLARLLCQLQGYPEPADPVASLQKFLQRQTFPIDVPEFVLEVPEEFQDRVPGNASLVLTHTNREGDRNRVVYRLGPEGGKPAREGRSREYRLIRRQGGAIDCQPGDQLEVSMELLDGEALGWVDQRSKLYQFERLSLPPRLHRGNQPASEGVVQKRIKLTWPGGEQAVPRVPDLMPQVRLE